MKIINPSNSFSLTKKQLEEMSELAFDGNGDAAFRIYNYYAYLKNNESPGYVWLIISVSLKVEKGISWFNYLTERKTLCQSIFFLAEDKLTNLAKTPTDKLENIQLLCLFIHYNIKENKVEKEKYEKLLRKREIKLKLFDIEKIINQIPKQEKK